MGVPRVFQWIVRKYPDTFVKDRFFLKTCDYVCFDVNGIIHPCVRESLQELGKFNQKDIENKIRDKIVEYILLTNPKKGIIICIDGIAPVAKMFQQRLRRFKSVQDKAIEREIYGKYDTHYPFEWDTNAITPFTDFMVKLDKVFVNDIIPHIKKEYPGNFKIYFSGSNEHGEGEHKIMELIRSFPKNKAETIVINGLDADLIFLSIGLERENIFLMREQDESLGYLNISMLKDNLFLEMQKKCTIPLDQRLIEKDFMVLSYFIGNDFLPCIFSADVFQIDSILDLYIEVLQEERKNLVFDTGKGISIDWIILQKLCEKLSVIEFSLIKRKVRKYMTIRDSDDKFDHSPILREIYQTKQRPREDHLRMMEPGWRDRYYEHYFHFYSNSWDKKNAMIVNYLEGLQWNLNYYLKGIQNWLWSYKYHASPFFSDIHFFIAKKGIRNLIFASREIRVKTRVPSSIEQLLIVLPPQSNHLIPEKYRNLIYHPKIQNYYPLEYELDYYYKIRDWEHKPILPDIDINNITKLVEQYS
jgi:5'-3' exonuclease